MHFTEIKMTNNRNLVFVMCGKLRKNQIKLLKEPKNLQNFNFYLLIDRDSTE